MNPAEHIPMMGSAEEVWGVQFDLCWQPHGGGGSPLTHDDVEKMLIGKAKWWRERIGEERRSEAAEIARANAAAASASRGK